MNRLQQFVAAVLEQEGAAVEAIEPEGLEVLAPPDLQQKLDLSELSRLGFGSALPSDAQRVSLESDWMERLAAILADRGRWLEKRIEPENPVPSDAERVLQHTLELLNATYRLQSVKPAWTRYWILRLRYTAVSDEKREGLFDLGLNMNSGATLDGLLDRLLENLEQSQDIAAATSAHALPEIWEQERMATLLQRTLPLRVRQYLGPFFRGMHRRQERDLERLYGYHDDLRRESLQRLSLLPKSGALTEKQKTDKARELQRLEAIGREYQAKVADLRQKYAMTVAVEWIQTLELVMPVQRFQVLIKRRKGERLISLDWNPLAHRLEQAPCEYSYTWEKPREVCDERLHLVRPEALGPCRQCDKAYCRACHPMKCPKCGHSDTND